MKLTIKDATNQVVFFQNTQDDTTRAGKLISYLMALPKGDKLSIEAQINGHPMVFVTGEIDITVPIRLLNGIIVKNTDGSTKEPAAEKVAAKAE